MVAYDGACSPYVSVRMAWISFGTLPCRKENLMTARVFMLLKSCALPDMLPFSLCNKKWLAICHMYRTLFPPTLSIPYYDNRKVRLRTYQYPLICIKGKLLFCNYDIWAQSFGLGQCNNIRLMSVTGCRTLHSNNLCSLQTRLPASPSAASISRTPSLLPSTMCLSLNLHNILVRWSQPQKPVSFSHYDLMNTVSVLLVWSAKFPHTESVFILVIHHSMHSAHIVTAVQVQTMSMSLMKLIKRETWYGEEYRRTSDLFHIYQRQRFNGTRKMAHWQFSV